MLAHLGRAHSQAGVLTSLWGPCHEDRLPLWPRPPVSKHLIRCAGDWKPEPAPGLSLPWHWGREVASGLSLFPDSPSSGLLSDTPWFPTPVCCLSFSPSSLSSPPGLASPCPLQLLSGRSLIFLFLLAGFGALCALRWLFWRWMHLAPSFCTPCSITTSTLGFLPHTSVRGRWSESLQVQREKQPHAD